jgi:ATP-binding cassette, subfamily F, member 3
VWRDHLLAEEARLNAHLAELDATPAGELDARIEETRDEVSGRLAEVHASLADMEAESGPARAAALLAGELWISFVTSRKVVEPLPGLGFSEEDQKRSTKSFSGGWRYVELPP